MGVLHVNICALALEPNSSGDSAEQTEAHEWKDIRESFCLAQTLVDLSEDGSAQSRRASAERCLC